MSDNIITFPTPENSEEEYSQLFLTVLMRKITDYYHLDPNLTAQHLSTYLPGLLSLTKATLKHIRSSPHHASLANQLLAESIVNSFKAEGLVSC